MNPCVALSDANLSSAGTHLVEGLAVSGLKPELHFPQLEARFLTVVIYRPSPPASSASQ